MLETLIVPACFLAAGLIGFRLGTPRRVAGGLAALGCGHLLAFLAAHQALAVHGRLSGWMHLASQLLFVGGFVAFVWLAAVYPDQKPMVGLMVAAAALGAAGPGLAAVTAPTPAVLDSERELGPVIHLLPASLSKLAVAPLLLLPLLAVVTFVVRYRRAEAGDRTAMRWPIASLGIIALLVLGGSLLGPGRQEMVTATFLLAAPVFPLATAFGPVVRHLDALSSEVHELRSRPGLRLRPAPPPGILARLTPRELTVLEAIAQGKSNPEIARSLHLSLSSVEKHVTSIFRKFGIADESTSHRRVSAVVAYRDALQVMDGGAAPRQDP